MCLKCTFILILFFTCLIVAHFRQHQNAKLSSCTHSWKPDGQNKKCIRVSSSVIHPVYAEAKFQSLGVKTKYNLCKTRNTWVNTVNPLLSPPGAYFFQAHLRRGLLKEDGIYSPKELEYKVEKLESRSPGSESNRTFKFCICG